MFIRKIYMLASGLLALTLLTSWALPTALSRQHVTPQFDQQAIEEAKARAESKKKKAQKPTLEDYRFARLAHQKNKLAYYADRDGYIWFDDDENKHSFFLSNFYPCSVKMWHMKFSCAEAAHQAAKFLHKPDLAVRFTDLNGEEALKLAQRHSYEQRSDWYKVREEVMYEILKAKFDKHPKLTELLLATGDAYLVEHTDRDAYWADGGDGKGKNRLGQLLMRIREEKGGIGPVSKPSKYRKFAHEGSK